MLVCLSLNDVFLANSSEAIWQLQPVNEGYNTEDARVFMLPETGPDNSILSHPVYLSDVLMSDFEITDQRQLNWIKNVVVGTDTFYFPFKYKSSNYGDPVTEYLMVLRVGGTVFNSG